jgi:xanthine dehydrogenase/oxidase
MAMVGKRFPLLVSYDVGVNETGKIEELNFNVICDCGAFTNEFVDNAVTQMFQSCYQAIGWTLERSRVSTNTPPNTYVRAPGSIKGVAAVEIIMNHIAFETGLDPIEVRRVNLIQDGDRIVEPNPFPTFTGPNLIPELLLDIENTYQYSARKAAVETFNQNNRWRKRGIALSIQRYPQAYGVRYGAYIAIYHVDGTVAVGHGGIEMGQGINTKVAQVVAHTLGIPLDKIVIKPTDNLIGANSDVTGGALTSELVSYAALRSAEVLRDRINEVRKEKKMERATWEEAVAAAHGANVDLRATFMHTPLDPPRPYDIWGLNAVEVEIDCLTGEFKVSRSDLIEDCGKSLSPEVDVGQVEGAYIMGMGFWTKERLVYDENNGKLLTNNTWEYKVPFAKCLPEDFKIKFISDRPNPFGVLSSKASGEAPVCLTITVVEAIRNAILSARRDAGNNEWFQMDLPISPDEIVRHCLTDASQFTY